MAGNRQTISALGRAGGFFTMLFLAAAAFFCIAGLTERWGVPTLTVWSNLIRETTRIDTAWETLFRRCYIRHDTPLLEETTDLPLARKEIVCLRPSRAFLMVTGRQLPVFAVILLNGQPVAYSTMGPLARKGRSWGYRLLPQEELLSSGGNQLRPKGGLSYQDYPGAREMWTTGQLEAVFPSSSSGMAQIEVEARAAGRYPKKGDITGYLPHLLVSWDGRLLAEETVRKSPDAFRRYRYTVAMREGVHTLGLAFGNAYSDRKSGINNNLVIGQVLVKAMEPEVQVGLDEDEPSARIDMSYLASAGTVGEDEALEFLFSQKVTPGQDLMFRLPQDFVRVVKCEEATHLAVVCLCPTLIREKVHIPHRGAYLRVGYGFLPQGASSATRGRIDFAVQVYAPALLNLVPAVERTPGPISSSAASISPSARQDSTKRTLFSHSLELGASPVWFVRRVDLSEFAGEDIEIEFVSRQAPDTAISAYALWGD